MSQLTHTQALSGINTGKIRQILASAALGLIILLSVGFAPVDMLHNATHDTRHSSGFPCH